MPYAAAGSPAAAAPPVRWPRPAAVHRPSSAWPQACRRSSRRGPEARRCATRLRPSSRTPLQDAPRLQTARDDGAAVRAHRNKPCASVLAASDPGPATLVRAPPWHPGVQICSYEHPQHQHWKY